VTTKSLPKYAGTLMPAPWSGLKLSEETIDLLRKAADRACPACAGQGYIHQDDNGLIHLCHCINRPTGPS